MTAEKYKVGDKVMLRADSRWAIPGKHSSNPIDCYGTITKKDDSYSINWSNGRSNTCYLDRDLYSYEEPGNIPKQSPSDILAEARLKYPVGTKYVALNDDGTVSRTSHIETSTRKPSWVTQYDRIDCGYDYIYVKGKWAEIVTTSVEPTSQPQPYVPSEAEVLARYPKGTWYMPIKDNGTIGDTPQESKGIYKKGDNFIWVNSSTSTGYIYDIVAQKWADIVANPEKTSVTKDDILAEAKRKFPVGTKYIPLDSRGEKWSNQSVSLREATWWNAGQIDIGDGLCYVDGKWAEIVTIDNDNDLILAKARNEYPIGTKYKPIDCNGQSYDNAHLVRREPNWHGSEGNIEGGPGYIYYQGKWAEIAENSIDYDAVLEIAKRKYPKGTKYLPLRSDGDAYSEEKISRKEAIWYHKKSEGDDEDRIEIGYGFAYVNGKWADVVTSTVSEKSEDEHKAELLAKFPVGTRFKPVYGDGTHSDSIYEVKSDWVLTRGVSSDSYWFLDSTQNSPHTAYIRTGDHDAAIIADTIISTESTDLRSKRVTLLPEIEVRRKIVI